MKSPLHKVLPYQQLTRLIGGLVEVASVRDPSSGKTTFVVTYSSQGAAAWKSPARFEDVDTAWAAGRVLAEFLGAELRV
jgi:hypothetical protein